MTGQPFRIVGERGLGGGSINSACRLDGEHGSYFVKTNSAARLDMFEAEAAGLEEIANSGTVRVPKPVCCGTSGGNSYIVLELLEFGGGGQAAMEELGAQLAAMHRVTQEHFGWYRDNTIGSTVQINTPQNGWIEFWRSHRLGFQLELAARNGYAGRLQRDGERLLVEFDCLFETYAPVPSLLHGDLWSGNYAIDRAGHPVIFDPAVYYGDREADLAMTELFGSFGSRFYAAYGEAWPLDPGYRVRKTFYNLYHIINHVNLFGDGYLGQAEHMVQSLLAECR